jgi:hypothetical protein
VRKLETSITVFCIICFVRTRETFLDFDPATAFEITEKFVVPGSIAHSFCRSKICEMSLRMLTRC